MSVELEELLLAEARLLAELPELVIRRYVCASCGDRVDLLPAPTRELVDLPTCRYCSSSDSMLELPSTFVDEARKATGPAEPSPSSIGRTREFEAPAGERQPGRARRRRQSWD